ncbi:hypothetical protein FHX06_000637 [Rhizobium sp. BK512]|uniref:DUF5054 domain-containing protein n=1 Tax=Rhizobium sp. BK512 TaxID=2587010 RepID=UPI0016167F50|nr:DUF5054 domain-containing protein [Rhizobium sp. BK512]MBB3559340.1 hypothetical protein [Rhizobium sp. BK512]
MTEKRVHLVFKTHLDIGFTDHAEKVRRQYHERFIPQAIETGAHFYAENPEEPKFIWTTGAWLIWDHLNSRSPAEVAALEQAIERGLIRWHGLPFTTHTELMSHELFRAGLSYSQELDRRFGKQTIAAKMTDVPGHTLGMVPLLAEAGIRFLHLGVNTASPPPEVPDIFRWRAPDGAEVVVMYQRSYGETYFPEGFDDGLSFAHTQDNIGPQSVPQTAEAYRDIRRIEPDAVIRGATLEEYGAILWEKRERFPVLELELGDSWIHGSATDPLKTAKFLALQRLYDRFAGEGLNGRRLAFGRGLAMVAEHTCGVDIKSYLRDDKAWARADFEAARKTDYRFAYTEASWDEQRGYVDQAVAELDADDMQQAQAALAELFAPALVGTASRETQLAIGGWSIELNEVTGDIATLTSPQGRRIAGRSGSLIAYRYESYDAADINRHMDTYLTHRQEWAVLDHDKPGLGASGAALSKVFVPSLESAGDGGVLLSMPAEAVERFGAPRQLALEFLPDDGVLQLRLSLRDKPANRMPEASFLSFTPAGAKDWLFRKMGLWHPAGNFARSGGAQLQAVNAVSGEIADVGAVVVQPLDTPLVAPQSWDFMTFCRGLPDFEEGIRFNLHNNKWGTNFPMWWEGDFSARFRLSLD